MWTENLLVVVIVTGAAFLIGLYQRQRGFSALMTVFGLALSVATILSLADSVGYGSWGTPDLAGSDGQSYYDQARELAQVGLGDYQAVVLTNYAGYQLLLAALFRIFGTSLLVGVVANDLLLLLSIACLYRATFLLTESPRAALLACAALMLTTAHIFYALMLLKEPAIDLAFGLMLLAISKAACEKSIGLTAVAYFLLAILTIITMRASLLLFLAILLVFTAGVLLKRRGHILAGFVGLLVLVAPFSQSFTRYELDTDFFTQIIVRNSVISTRFQDGDLDLTGIAGQTIGFYINLPFIFKIFLFPLPLVVQILLPFDFWSGRFLDEHIASLFVRNLNPLWYLFVVIWIAYAVAHVRSIENQIIRRLLLAGLFYFVVVAIVYGGLIPRYGAPALLFMFPAVGYWWARSREEPAVRQSTVTFFVHYYVFAVFAGLAFIAFQLSRG